MEATSAPRPHALRLPRPKRLLAAYSDESLVEHIRKGDSGAFEVLYDRHSAGILGFCRHILGSQADAEDAVQHTFIAAHADIERRGDRQLAVKAWLYTIARNRCLSILRARREHPSDGVAELATLSMAQDVEQRAELRALLADVAKLPDDQREALVLSEVGDLSHVDIAAVLGCEVSKVKSLVFQARSALIDRRTARETSCEEIREQIATLRGGALRRSHLRHHIEACPGCAEYREEVRRQRAMLAIALPVVPTAALRAHVLGSLGLGGGAAAGAGIGAGTGAGGLGLAAQGGTLAKVGIATVLAIGGAGGAAVVHNGGLPLVHGSSASHSQGGAAHSAAVSHTVSGAVTAAAGTGTTRAVAEARHESKNHSTGSHRSASGTRHGFTPITGQSNGAQARQFAATRGRGVHGGTVHKHVTRHSHVKRVHVKHVVSTPVAPVKVAPTHTQTTHSQPTHTQTPRTKAPADTTPTTTAPAGTTPTTSLPTTTVAPAPAGGTGKTLGGTKKTSAAG